VTAELVPQRWISLIGSLLLVLAAHSANAEPLAVGDLLMSCEYWGVTRIEPATGEQHPIGVGTGGTYNAITGTTTASSG
jgi:hypothetical protein